MTYLQFYVYVDKIMAQKLFKVTRVIRIYHKLLQQKREKRVRKKKRKRERKKTKKKQTNLQHP